MKKIYKYLVALWSIYSIGFILSSVIISIYTVIVILINGKVIYVEPNLFIINIEIISLFISLLWFLTLVFSLIAHNKYIGVN